MPKIILSRKTLCKNQQSVLYWKRTRERYPQKWLEYGLHLRDSVRFPEMVPASKFWQKEKKGATPISVPIIKKNIEVFHQDIIDKIPKTSLMRVVVDGPPIIPTHFFQFQHFSLFSNKIGADLIPTNSKISFWNDVLKKKILIL